ncbi:MAG: hypothetical protein GX760_00010, partial [Erysipelothrix sp.]|nr:hypothetical protein [Erysipelothrix sp.]
MKIKKKRQRKILSILLLISLMIPIFTMHTLALSTKFELNPNKTVVSQGDKVTIKVKTKDVNQISSGINSYVGVLGYDSKYLSYESGTSSVNGWMFVYNQTSKGLIGYDPTGADFKTSDFEVFTLTFKVLDNAPLGDTTVTFKDIDVADG